MENGKLSIVKDGAVNSNVIETQFATATKDEIEIMLATAKELAKQKNADTDTNYIPTEDSIVLKGYATIPIIDIVNKPMEQLFAGIRFKLVVSGFGSRITTLKLGDNVDIKNSQFITHRPFIYNPNSTMIAKAKLGNRRDLVIVGSVTKDSANKNRILNLDDISVSMQNAMSDNDSPKELFKGNESLNIVEYFLTEYHNISGTYVQI